ncbi:MAG: TldD/PmbA family protein [Actinomycetia bacterium]|nr:TldD/PmbA family protein [Actinomycetes bacterium]
MSDDASSDPEVRARANIGDLADLLAMADRLVGSAMGTEQVEVMLGRGASTSVKVHGGEVESLTSAGSTGAGVRVIRDGRVGFAHCGSLDADVLDDTLAEARDNCRFAEPDEANGLAVDDGVAVTPQTGWYDEVIALPVESKVGAALDLERRVTGADDRVTSARTTSWGDGWGQAALVSTAGIRVSSESTSCSLGTQPLARSGEETQIGWGSDVARVPAELDIDKVVDDAVTRATKLLGATKPESARMAVLLEGRLAITLLGIVAGMLSAESVQKGRSPFADRLGEQIAADCVQLTDDPTRSESLGADEFDGEGLATRPNPLIVGGRLDRFLFDSTTARRAGVDSTASAVRGLRGLPGPGPQLLVMEPGTTSAEDLLAGVELGLAVESFSGLHSGVNPTSGDFSVGGNGVMIRDGELAEPVQELTIASTLQRLLSDVTAVGSDFEWLPSGSGAASMLIGDVSVSGA